MSNESQDPQDRIDKAMGDMQELQRRFDAMNPDQRKELAQRLKANEPELRELLGKLGAAYQLLKGRQKSGPERVAKAIAENTQFSNEFRALKSRRDLAKDWCQGWLVPVAFSGKKTALKTGKGVKAFWNATLEIVPDKNETLDALVGAWEKAPMLALPALLTQIASLLLDSFGKELENRILPFNLASTIILRLVIEIQISAGMDPCETDELEQVLKDWNRVAAGEKPEAGLKDLTLKAMLAYGWLASILHGSEKK